MAAVKKGESKSTVNNAEATKGSDKAPETTATKGSDKAPETTATKGSDKAPETTATKAAAKVKGLRIIASKDGFRRAGREWHGTTEVSLDELTKEQVKQLLDEPRLAVQEIEIEA